MQRIVIRRLEEKDIPKIADIHVRGWKTAYEGMIDETFLASLRIEQDIANIRRNCRQSDYIVAVLEDKVVGFCCYVDHNVDTQDIQDVDCELLALYVEPDRKHQGIGTRLFQFAVRDLKSKGKTDMMVSCLKENMPSRQFYEHMGGIAVVEKKIPIKEQWYWEVGYIFDVSSIDVTK